MTDSCPTCDDAPMFVRCPDCRMVPLDVMYRSVDAALQLIARDMCEQRRHAA